MNSNRESLSQYYIRHLQGESQELPVNYAGRCFLWIALGIALFFIADAAIGLLIYDAGYLDLLLFQIPSQAVYCRIVVSVLITAFVTTIMYRRRRSALMEKELKSGAKWFSTTMKSAGVALFATDRSGAILFVNPLGELLTDLTLEDAIGKPLWDVCHLQPEQGNTKVDGLPLDRSIATGREYELAACTLTPHGASERIPVMGRIAPIHDENSTRIGSVLAIHDLTAYRKSAIQQRRLSTAVEQSNDPVAIVDMRGIIQYVNPAMAALVGEELVKRKAMDFKHLVRNRSALLELKHTVEGDTNWRGELVLDLKETHEDVTIEAMVAPIRDELNEPIGFAAICRDVTDERLLQRQLFQSQKMEAMGILTSGICHDFNNVLTVILGYGDLLLGKLHDEHPRSMATMVVEAAERGQAMCRQLLDFSRKEPEIQGVADVNQTVEEMRGFLLHLVREDIRLKIDLQEGLDCIPASTSKLRQVIMNLCMNARDAMPEGGELRIETRKHPVAGKNGDRDCIELTVRDTGIGINEEVVERIFEPFFTTKEVGQGTGLGLSIVYGFVQQYGLNIRVDSKPGQGTSFTLILPTTQGEPAEEDEPEGALQDGKGEIILLVEDEELVRGMLREMLVAHGYKVIEAENAGDALDACRFQPIHLLLTDVVLRGTNGVDLAAEFRKKDPSQKVLYISGHIGHPAVAKARSEQDSAFLEKPIERALLLRAIRELLEETSQV